MRGLRAGTQAVNIAGHTARFVLWTNFATSTVAAILVTVGKLAAERTADRASTDDGNPLVHRVPPRKQYLIELAA